MLLVIDCISVLFVLLAKRLKGQVCTPKVLSFLNMLLLLLLKGGICKAKGQTCWLTLGPFFANTTHSFLKTRNRPVFQSTSWSCKTGHGHQSLLYKTIVADCASLGMSVQSGCSSEYQPTAVRGVALKTASNVSHMACGEAHVMLRQLAAPKDPWAADLVLSDENGNSLATHKHHTLEAAAFLATQIRSLPNWAFLRLSLPNSGGQNTSHMSFSCGVRHIGSFRAAVARRHHRSGALVNHQLRYISKHYAGEISSCLHFQIKLSMQKRVGPSCQCCRIETLALLDQVRDNLKNHYLVHEEMRLIQ